MYFLDYFLDSWANQAGGRTQGFGIGRISILTHPILPDSHDSAYLKILSPFNQLSLPLLPENSKNRKDLEKG
jgi:hypothetical protein